MVKTLTGAEVELIPAATAPPAASTARTVEVSRIISAGPLATYPASQ